MRSDLLLLTLVLSLVCEGAILAQGRLASESGGAAPAATDAAHLKLKPAEWRSLNERRLYCPDCARSALPLDKQEHGPASDLLP